MKGHRVVRKCGHYNISSSTGFSAAFKLSVIINPKVEMIDVVEWIRV